MSIWALPYLSLNLSILPLVKLFQKGLYAQRGKQEIIDIVSLIKYGGKITKCIQSP